MAPKTEEWLFLGVIGFLAGVVANIIIPARRGVFGFLSAAIVGVFCGGVAGISASAGGWPEWCQYLLAAFVGVLGDRLLTWLLKSTLATAGSKRFGDYVAGNKVVEGEGDRIHIDEIAGGQNNVGEIDVEGGQSGSTAPPQ